METAARGFRPGGDRGKLLGKCLIVTFIWGLAAHAYGLLNGIFTHDSLNVLASDAREELWKLQLGRFMVPVYRGVIREGLAMPWLLGMLGLLYIGLAVYLMVRLFELRSGFALVLITGFCVTNITVTALIATYSYEFDLDMLAMLLATASAFCWCRVQSRWKGLLLGAVLLMLSLGFYQSYITVTVALIMIRCILCLLEGERAAEVLRRGGMGILMLLLGGALYWLVVRITVLCGVELAESYDGLNNLFARTEWSVFGLLRHGYTVYLWKLTEAVPAYPRAVEALVNGLMVLASLTVVIGALRERRPEPWVAVLLVLLGVLLPLGMNLIYLIDGAMLHELMLYAFCCTYILAALMIWQVDLKKGYMRPLRIAAGILLAVLLWGNLQTSNALYLKKDLEREATLSVMTRVAERIESSPDYVMGETPVAIYGLYEQDTVTGFEAYSYIVGAAYNSALAYESEYGAYFKYILNSPIRICGDSTWERMRGAEELAEMPCFPYDGCVRMVDGVLLVKMSESY